MAPLAFLLLAYLFLALAILGVFLPGLPTVPFLLLAAWFSARGSKRLNKWLYEHPKFGSVLKNWEQKGAVSINSKIIAIVMICGSWAFLFVFIASTWGFVGISATFLLVSIYIVCIRKWPICPISSLRSKFYPRNINHIPPVKFFARLDLDQIFLFLDAHYIATRPEPC